METLCSAIRVTSDLLSINLGKFKDFKFNKFLNRKMYRKVSVNRICLRSIFRVRSVLIRGLFIIRCKLGLRTKPALFSIDAFLVSLLGRITNFSYRFIMRGRG